MFPPRIRQLRPPKHKLSYSFLPSVRTFVLHLWYHSSLLCCQGSLIGNPFIRYQLLRANVQRFRQFANCGDPQIRVALLFDSLDPFTGNAGPGRQFSDRIPPHESDFFQMRSCNIHAVTPHGYYCKRSSDHVKTVKHYHLKIILAHFI